VLAAAHLLLAQALPALVAAGVVLALWIVLTGALHLDGLGDCCDGLYGGTTPAERLRIMKDPHAGAMAVIGIVVILMLKWAALANSPLMTRGRDLVLIACLGRYAMVVMGSTLPYARAEGGTAQEFVRHAKGWALAGATLWSLVIAGWQGWRGLGLLGAALLVALVLRWLFHRTLGGVTGDALGATCELTEATLLVIASGHIP